MDIIIFLILLALGYGFGRYNEQRHYKSIIEREQTLNTIPAIASRIPPRDVKVTECQLVSGNAVISVDFFKKFLFGLRSLVGGRVASYETLVDRARREAILRMKEQALGMGADFVFNIKYETSSISKGQKQQVGAIEVLAYGTALVTNQHTATVAGNTP